MLVYPYTIKGRVTGLRYSGVSTYERPYLRTIQLTNPPYRENKDSTYELPSSYEQKKSAPSLPIEASGGEKSQKLKNKQKKITYQVLVAPKQQEKEQETAKSPHQKGCLLYTSPSPRD